MLRLTGAPHDPALLDLPWDVPLEEWPDDRLVALPRGISRHVVRFVALGSTVYAVKEIGGQAARREYALLRDLQRLRVPCVEPVGVLEGRTSSSGADLEPALVTRHLQFSLPYRSLFSRTLRPDTTLRLLDALAALLVRLHLAGFGWGDCSLSNTLFRRDAGAFAAYLVDAETGELHPTLSDGQRRTDVETARINITGELMDLAAGGLLDPVVEPVATGRSIAERYAALWAELTEPEVFAPDERYKVEARIARLNSLGFDVAELELGSTAAGGRLQMVPKVVDAGHHSRRLLRLTGLDVEENQARRLLNDLDAYAAGTGQTGPGAPDEQVVAHRWLTSVFEPVLLAVPAELRGKLEPAEVFHEVLVHRWLLSERAGRDVGTSTAVAAYVRDVLSYKPDERAVLGSREAVGMEDTQELRIVFPAAGGEPSFSGPGA